MIIATPAVQINTSDGSTNPQNNISIQGGGIGLSCANGAMMQDGLLAPSSSNVALSFPPGVITAVVIAVVAITTTDLIVNAGTTPQAFNIPAGQGMLFYGLTSAKISLSSALGGKIQYAIGG